MRCTKKFFAACLCFAILGSLFLSTNVKMVSAQESDSVEKKAEQLIATSTYDTYCSRLQGKVNAQQEIMPDVQSYIAQQTDGVQLSDEYDAENEMLVWKTGTGKLTYTIDVPKTALYNFSLKYLMLNETGLDLKIGLLIDGSYPFEEARALTFPRMWENATNTWKQDEKGNDLTPEQKTYGNFVAWSAKDNTGVAVQPYTFLLTSGIHTMTIEAEDTPFVLAEIAFLPLENVPSYDTIAPSAESLTDDSVVEPILLQGENADMKSSSSMVPKSDNTDVTLVPSNVKQLKLNYIGGSSWKSPNETVYWNFKVKKAGYYKIGFHYKQDQIINGETYRWLKIDGKTPFSEAKNIAFSYSTSWEFLSFADGDGTPYLMWLDAGEHTQSFYCMFYRTDILKKLGLKVPTTWDEFILASTIIQRNNMQVYVPYTRITSSTAVDSGVGSLNLFPSLMLQSGLPIYNESQTATVIDQPAAVDVFDTWTKLYTDYGFLKEADFYNRFRTGSMPLGIANYTTCLTIMQTAPEIEGRWAMVSIPSSDGKNHAAAGGGTGCSILSTTTKKSVAWTFLKWWTSTDTQVRFSQNLESVLGLVGRVATSNVEAFKKMGWKSQDKEQILRQWKQVTEIPEVPGSYYLSRSIDQAFWEIVNGKSNAMDAVSKWSEIANQEIDRKVREYSVLGEKTDESMQK